MTTTVCTYTYNDAELARGFLADIPKWSVQPDEVVIVDDGSVVPFTCDDSVLNGVPLRIIRLPENKGFFGSRSVAYSEAKGEAILAADCDARLQPNYLEFCLRHLKNAEIGMVTGAREQDCGTGPVGMFLTMFGDNHTRAALGPVDFIPGLAFALRREVWFEVGGFGDKKAGIGSDHVLCGRIKAHGYSLILDPCVSARQIRRMSRFAVCRRYWLWLSANTLDLMRQVRSLPEGLYGHLVPPMITRIEKALEHKSPASIYIDILYVSYVIVNVCGQLEQSGEIPPQSAQIFLDKLEKKVRPWPALAHLLKADMLALGIPPAKMRQQAPQEWNWDITLEYIDICANHGLLDWLNRHGVALVLEEEGQGSDFSIHCG